ncbi:NifB/NifX family molybdenum-iron cluster-binding protein [Humidesulfovibrio sp.]
MLVCLACFEERVAALLETATQLRLYRQEPAGLAPCGAAPVPETGVLALADQLAASGVELLICGGLSGCALSALRQSGVAVAPWVGGAADDVASAFGASGLPGLAAYRLPGCGQGNCQGRRLGLGCRGRALKALRARKLNTKGSASHD